MSEKSLTGRELTTHCRPGKSFYPRIRAPKAYLSFVLLFFFSLNFDLQLQVR